MRRAIRPVLLDRYNNLRNSLPEGLSAWGDPTTLTIPDLQRAIEQLEAAVGQNAFRQAQDQQVGRLAVALDNLSTPPDPFANTDFWGDGILDRVVPPNNTKPVTESTFKPPYSLTNLSPKQVWISQQLGKGKEKLLGLEVRVVANRNGSVMSHLYEGIIVRIDENNGTQIFTIDFDNSDPYDAYIYQIEPLKKVTPTKISQKEIEEKEKENRRKIVQRIAENYNNTVNHAYRSLKTELDYKKEEYQNMRSRITRLEGDITRMEKEIAKTSQVNKTAEEIVAIVEELNTHDKVKKAFISDKGNIMVITKPLFAIDLKTDQDILDKPMGQFVFRITLANGGNRVDATNLTYAMTEDRNGHEIGRAYFHPNINTTNICWGNNQIQVNEMVKQGQLYQLVDFMITFFSVFPHEDGSNPWIDFEEWYEVRKPVDITHDLIKNSYKYIFEKPLTEGKVTLSTPKAEPTNVPVALSGDLPVQSTHCDYCNSTEHVEDDCPERDDNWEDDDE